MIVILGFGVTGHQFWCALSTALNALYIPLCSVLHLLIVHAVADRLLETNADRVRYDAHSMVPRIFGLA
jgi:hypothetical protein